MLPIASAVSLPAQALTPSQASQQYDSYASNYDDLDGGVASDILGIEQARAKLLRRASGRILEIGAGTGLNLPNYDPKQVESLTLVDISEGMLQQARVKVPKELSRVVHMEQADATSQLVDRFGTDAFDTVVDSFSLCVMGNQGARRCLQQVAQVVRSTGTVLLLENSRSSNPLLGLYQDATAEAASIAGGKGCVYNQNVRALIESTGSLEILEEHPYAAGLFRAYICRRTSP